MSFDVLVFDRSKFQNSILKSKRFLSSVTPFFTDIRDVPSEIFLPLVLVSLLLALSFPFPPLFCPQPTASCDPFTVFLVSAVLRRDSERTFRRRLPVVLVNAGEPRFSSSRYQINRGILAGETKAGLNGNNSKVKPVPETRLRKPLSKKQHTAKFSERGWKRSGMAASRKI